METRAAGASLAFDLVGPKEQPALLLVHGFMSSNLQWEPNRETLGRHFRLIATELWGHGDSPVPRDPASYRVESYLAQFEALREGLGIDRWFVCGQSFGAGIMMRYALERPEVVRGLIVTNSRSALNNATPTEGRRLGREVWQEMDLRSLPYHSSHAKRIPETLRSRMAEAADRIDPYALWQAAETTTRDLSCRDTAAKIGVPTLLVNGRWESSFQGDRDFLAAALPGVSIVDLDGGHSINIEASAGFDAAVIEFAAGRAARPSVG